MRRRSAFRAFALATVLGVSGLAASPALAATEVTSYDTASVVVAGSNSGSDGAVQPQLASTGASNWVWVGVVGVLIFGAGIVTVAVSRKERA